MRATSIEALEKFAPYQESARERVYQYLVDQEDRGATDQEMQKALGISGDTLRPTRGALLKHDLIYDSGMTRKNDKGNSCIVWVVAKIDQLGMF